MSSYDSWKTRSDRDDWDGGDYGYEDSPLDNVSIGVCPECRGTNLRQILKYNPRLRRDEIAAFECQNCGAIL